jgi:para-aminobenzoate synthetase/4-amino-4-deoxychorismate lyase
MLVRDGRVQALDRHIARLTASVHGLYGHALGEREGAHLLALARGHRGSHRMRVLVRPTAAGLEIESEIAPLDTTRAGAPVVLSPIHRRGGHGAHKWIDRRALAAPAGDTPLLLDRDEEVLEAAWANVWIREGERVVTPPADGRLLPGITRARLLALAPALGLTALVERVTLDRLRCADEVFVTSSLRQAVPAGLAVAPAAASPPLAALASALAAADWS